MNLSNSAAAVLSDAAICWNKVSCPKNADVLHNQWLACPPSTPLGIKKVS